jgi:hypothetical protein
MGRSAHLRWATAAIRDPRAEQGDMTTSREAYDLHNPACRANAWYRLKHGDWKHLWFLRLVWSDTINKVCTPYGNQRSK